MTRYAILSTDPLPEVTMSPKGFLASSLSFQLGVGFLVLATVAVLNALTVHHLLNEQAGIADTIGVAGRLRMLSQKLAAETFLTMNAPLGRGGKVDGSFYTGLWAALKQGKSFRGVFVNRHREGLLFHEEKTISPIKDREGCITHYVSTGRNVNARIATEQQLHRLAYYDALTGLPNRKLFLNRLEEHIEETAGSNDGLLLLLDINNIKKINDTLGYRAGDQALRLIASRLEAFCQTACSAARLGGDEFAVVVTDCDDPEQASAVENVLDLLGQPLDLGDQEVFVSASIGIARYPQDAGNAEDLLRHADLALHRAKEAGRNVFLFYQASMRDSLQEDLQIETALHGALERNELHLVFQPIIRSTDRSVVGLEALLRWESPDLGAVPPVRFIPQMERNGLIVPVWGAGFWPPPAAR